MQRELEKLEDLLSLGFIFKEEYEARKADIYARFELEYDLTNSGGNNQAKHTSCSEKEFNFGFESAFFNEDLVQKNSCVIFTNVNIIHCPFLNTLFS